MVEEMVVTDHKTLVYDGLVDIPGFFKMVDDYFGQLGFEKKDALTSENVTEDGKFIEARLEPWLGLSDYAESKFYVRLQIWNAKEVEVEIDGVKQRLHRAKVKVITDAFLITDYENRLEERPLAFFVRTIMDRYVLRSMTNKYKKIIKDHVEGLYTQLHAYLNLHRYRTS